MDIEIDVPPYFLCPISLEIMRDPVTVSTGITYDRENIEKWIFSVDNNTCPVTKQVLLLDTDLTPNHTLRRLIQAWCTLNAVERIPTPKPPVDKAQIVKLLNNAKTSQSLMKSLRRLRTIAAESERNRRCIESAGAVEFLASIVRTNNYTVLVEDNTGDEAAVDQIIRVSDEALSILYYLQISKTGLKNLLGKNFEFVEVLMQVLRRGSYQSRAYAALLLKPMFEVADPNHLISLKPELFVEIVRVLRDQISSQASKAALQILVETCRWGRNRIKAVEAGAVSILIELLLDTTDKRACEIILMVLDQLCGCAEGRAELIKHSAGIAVVSKKILRVSHLASEKAVRILYSVAKFSATPSVLQEMLLVGVVSKLCLVLQVNSTTKTIEKANEILKLHSRVWKSSPCIPRNLLSSYPSS
ncbi:U box domain [Macleaya cordata]|uniref:U-box domain-containing protein n=1 Tax=Macleaya cordata TaxID=56857 RepID=A0A200Q9J7_MACCD|nr:U box domain [Macleaya cordata]